LALRAKQFGSLNPTYARDFDSILGISCDEVFPIEQCRCGFVYAKLLPDFLPTLYREVIQATDPTPAWVGHQLGLVAQLLVPMRERTRVRVLDYGCGAGALVRAIRGPTIDAVGFDPHRGEFAAEPVGPFDGIVLSDVLEHVPDPKATLLHCHGLLASEGLLVVNVPTFNGALNPLSLEVNPWEHLNYFSGRSLRAMLASTGFVQVARSRRDRLANWLHRDQTRLLVSKQAVGVP
jgi:2-polyprenyl-3-methyl-5-hydroxy-6-metoxy-1,4-benzoquinol methylase